MRRRVEWSAADENQRVAEIDMTIKSTSDLEGALGGPQVQLSQAERHLTGRRSPTALGRKSNRKKKHVRQSAQKTAKGSNMLAKGRTC